MCLKRISRTKTNQTETTHTHLGRGMSDCRGKSWELRVGPKEVLSTHTTLGTEYDLTYPMYTSSCQKRTSSWLENARTSTDAIIM